MNDPEITFWFWSTFWLIVLLLLGTYFSAAEMAFSSLNRARIKTLAETAGKRGQLAERVVKLSEEHFEEVISTLLICNNTVAIGAATLSAAIMVRLMGEWGYLASTIGVSAIVIVLTDILPKSLAKQSPEQMAVKSVSFLHFWMLLLKPVNAVVLRVNRGLNRAIVSSEPDPTAEEENLHAQEIRFMVEEAEKEGAFEEQDSTIITNAIEFNELTAWDIITPRVDISGISDNASISDVARVFLATGYSRLPVYQDTLDNIIGVIHLRDFLRCFAQVVEGDENTPQVLISQIISPIVFTVTNARITDVLKLMKNEKSHIAIVTDEYGGTEGMVTMDDILERLVGDIWDETDETIEEFTQISEQTYKILCNAYIDDMFAYFGIKATSESNTVGGWIMDNLRGIPETGDTFDFENLTVTVSKAGNRRAEECLVVVTPPSEVITES